MPARTVLLNDPNPPALALVMAPFGALPYDLAFVLWLALGAAALALAVVLIGRDAAADQRARLLPFALLAPTSLVALAQGQTTPLLLLAVAAGAPALLVLRPQLLPLYAAAALRSRRGSLALAASLATVAALSFAAAGPDGMAQWPLRLAHAASEVGTNEVSLPALARRAAGSALLGLYASAALILAFVPLALRAPLASGPLALLAAPHALLHDVLFAYPAVARVARTRTAAWVWCVSGTAASLAQLVGVPALQVWLIALSVAVMRGRALPAQPEAPPTDAAQRSRAVLGPRERRSQGSKTETRGRSGSAATSENDQP